MLDPELTPVKQHSEEISLKRDRLRSDIEEGKERLVIERKLFEDDKKSRDTETRERKAMMTALFNHVNLGGQAINSNVSLSGRSIIINMFSQCRWGTHIRLSAVMCAWV